MRLFCTISLSVELCCHAMPGWYSSLSVAIIVRSQWQGPTWLRMFLMHYCLQFGDAGCCKSTSAIFPIDKEKILTILLVSTSYPVKLCNLNDTFVIRFVAELETWKSMSTNIPFNSGPPKLHPASNDSSYSSTHDRRKGKQKGGQYTSAFLA